MVHFLSLSVSLSLFFSLFFIFILCFSEISFLFHTAAASSEIRDTDDVTLLFRTDSVCTRFMRYYNSTFGHEYLHLTIGSFVELIQRKYLKKMDLNLCQTVDGEAEEREKAIQQTRVVYEHFLRFLLGTAPHIPTEILEVGQSISRTVRDKFGQSSGDTFLCGYFFLRFLCPALASPASTIHLEVSPNVQKFCILLSRILQASVNNKEFESENMHFANEMVRSSQQQIGVFFSCLRKGSFENEEAIVSGASEGIRKDLKKYRHKCHGGSCGPEAIIPMEESFCLLYTSPSPRDGLLSRMPSSA